MFSRKKGIMEHSGGFRRFPVFCPNHQREMYILSTPVVIVFISIAYSRLGSKNNLRGLNEKRTYVYKLFI